MGGIRIGHNRGVDRNFRTRRQRGGWHPGMLSDKVIWLDAKDASRRQVNDSDGVEAWIDKANYGLTDITSGIWAISPNPFDIFTDATESGFYAKTVSTAAGGAFLNWRACQKGEVFRVRCNLNIITNAVNVVIGLRTGGGSGSNKSTVKIITGTGSIEIDTYIVCNTDGNWYPSIVAGGHLELTVSDFQMELVTGKNMSQTVASASPLFNTNQIGFDKIADYLEYNRANYFSGITYYEEWVLAYNDALLPRYSGHGDDIGNYNYLGFAGAVIKYVSIDTVDPTVSHESAALDTGWYLLRFGSSVDGRVKADANNVNKINKTTGSYLAATGIATYGSFKIGKIPRSAAYFTNNIEKFRLTRIVESTTVEKEKIYKYVKQRFPECNLP